MMDEDSEKKVTDNKICYTCKKSDTKVGRYHPLYDCHYKCTPCMVCDLTSGKFLNKGQYQIHLHCDRCDLCQEPSTAYNILVRTKKLKPGVFGKVVAHRGCIHIALNQKSANTQKRIGDNMCANRGPPPAPQVPLAPLMAQPLYTHATFGDFILAQNVSVPPSTYTPTFGTCVFVHQAQQPVSPPVPPPYTLQDTSTVDTCMEDD